MKLNTTEYITLQSINPAENRYRAYRISITSIKTTKQIYAVTCSWGRVSKLSQHKHFIFDTEIEANKFITFLLAKRKRNHYSIVNKSSSFLGIHKTIQLPKVERSYHQISLFAEAV